MKVEFLKDCRSAIGHYVEGSVHDLEHDAYTIENWIETGYCKAVEKVKAKLVKKDEDKSSSNK
jgi:hypothetical protein